MAASTRPIEPLSEKDAARFHNSYRVDESGCWVWIASMTYAGYGRLRIGGTEYRAHRVSYAMHVGEIPGDLGLDHLCRNRACCNPQHLEPVTQRVNLMRGLAPASLNAVKSECHRGHAFDAENTYYPPVGGRHCRKCMRLSAHKYRQRLRLAKAAQ